MSQRLLRTLATPLDFHGMPIPLLACSIGAVIGTGLLWYTIRHTSSKTLIEPVPSHQQRTESAVLNDDERNNDQHPPPPPPKYTPQETPTPTNRFKFSKRETSLSDNAQSTSSDYVSNPFSPNKKLDLDMGGGPVCITPDRNKSSWKSRLHFGKKERSGSGHGHGVGGFIRNLGSSAAKAAIV